MAVTSATDAPTGAGEPATAALPWAPLWARGAADTASRLQDALNTRGAAAVLQEIFSLPESKDGQRSRRSEDIATTHWLQKLGSLEHLSCGFLQQAPKQNLRSASSSAQDELEIDIADDEGSLHNSSAKSSETQSLGAKVGRGKRSLHGVTSPHGSATPVPPLHLNELATPTGSSTPVPPLQLSEVLASQNYYSLDPVSHEDTEPLGTVPDESGRAGKLDGESFSAPAEDDQGAVHMNSAPEVLSLETSKDEQLTECKEHLLIAEEIAADCQIEAGFYTEETDKLPTVAGACTEEAVALETDHCAQISAAANASPTADEDTIERRAAAVDNDVLTDTAAGVAETEAEREPVGRWKPTLESDWSLPSSVQAVVDPALSFLDSELRPHSLALQVLSCLEGTAGNEKPVWLRVAGDDAICKVDGSIQPLLQEFCTDNLRVAVCCRTGSGIAGISQDNYSMTRFVDGTNIYVVCDGHGALGHLASFRVVQSLPRFIQEEMAKESCQGPANVIARAFMLANVDLFNFAAKHNLDFNTSGTTAAVALQQGDGVHVAWLGDTRALIASVADSGSNVDLMSPVHAPSMESEFHRILSKGAEIRESRCQCARVYAPAATQTAVPSTTPAGLTVSRALGDYSLSPYGLIGHPDLTKTSFASVPGLVLLASGGLCDHLGEEDNSLQDTGEVLLDLLMGEGKLISDGSHKALSDLCDVVQEVWRQQSGQGVVCEDVTGLLLHWVDKASQSCDVAPPLSCASPSASSAQQVQETSVASSLPSVKPVTRDASIASAISSPEPSSPSKLTQNYLASSAQKAQESTMSSTFVSSRHSALAVAPMSGRAPTSPVTDGGPMRLDDASQLPSPSNTQQATMAPSTQTYSAPKGPVVVQRVAQSHWKPSQATAPERVGASQLPAAGLCQAPSLAHCGSSKALVEGPRLPEGPRVTRPPSYDR